MIKEWIDIKFGHIRPNEIRQHPLICLVLNTMLTNPLKYWDKPALGDPLTQQENGFPFEFSHFSNA